MQYRTDWKQFLKYDEKGRRSHEFPVYLVDTAPNEKQYLYHDEYTALVAAEKAAKDARRAAREAELAASRPEASGPSESRASEPGRRAYPPGLPAGAGRCDSLPPDIERHSRRCVVCSHPDRDAIEGEFIRWRSPHKIARDYSVTDRNSIYRHAHATNLFEARRRQIGRVLESYLETIDDTPPADFDPVTRAVRVYAHLNANGAWIEPLRRVHITHSQSPWPDPDFQPDPQPSDDDPHGQPTHRLDDSQEFSQVPAGTGERVGQAFRPDSRSDEARECWESERAEPRTPSPATRDPPSASAEQMSHIRPPGGGNFSSHINRRAERRTSVELSPESRRDDTKVARHVSAGNSGGERRIPSARIPAPPFSREPQSTHSAPRHSRSLGPRSTESRFAGGKNLD